jgi:hypothetical protein
LDIRLAAEIGEGEEAKRKAEMRQVFEQTVAESVGKLGTAMDARMEELLQQIMMIEERLDRKKKLNERLRFLK